MTMHEGSEGSEGSEGRRGGGETKSMEFIVEAGMYVRETKNNKLLFHMSTSTDYRYLSQCDKHRSHAY